MDTDWRAVFEETYAAPPSRVAERVWRTVLGDEYPDGIDPFSYVSRTELARFAREVNLGPATRWSTSAVGGAARACGSPPRRARG